MAALLCLLIAFLSSAFADDVLLPPPAHSENPVAVLMYPRQDMTAPAYQSVVAAMQNASSSSVGVFAGIVGDTSAPDVAFPRILAELQSHGLPASAPVFVAAHGPASSASILAFAASPPASVPVAGAMLLGGFIPRSQRGASHGPAFSKPVLTLAGELDGVCRLTRCGAEAYYTQIVDATNPTSAATEFPVVVVPGASHMSFASGSPPSAVLQRDLMPAVSAPQAHMSIGTTVASFLQAHHSSLLNPQAVKVSRSLLQRSVFVTTSPVLDPIVSAMWMAGSHRLRPVCNSDFPTNPTCNYPIYPGHSLPPGPSPAPNPLPPTDCICGSSFVEANAQKLMSSFSTSSQPTTSTVTSDAFHDVSDVHPFHLPKIWNACSSSSDAACVLNTTSVTMPVFEDGSSDDGLAPLSAFEFRTKLKSRQATWQAAGITVKDQNSTDGSLAICRGINAASYAWATANAPPSMKATFARVGEELKMVDDIVAPIGLTGPTWIKKPLTYNRVPATPSPGSQAKSVVEVQSWTFLVDNINHGDDPWWLPVGMHYCKILSPFRAMEWLVVDGLRQWGSLANATSTL